MKANKIKALKLFLYGLAIVILALLIIIFFYKNILLTFILLSVLAIICFIIFRSWMIFTSFVIAFVIGPSLEMIAISFGVWSYAYPNFINIPAWLIVLWGVAGIAFYLFLKSAKELGVKELK